MSLVTFRGRVALCRRIRFPYRSLTTLSSPCSTLSTIDFAPLAPYRTTHRGQPPAGHPSRRSVSSFLSFCLLFDGSRRLIPYAFRFPELRGRRSGPARQLGGRPRRRYHTSFFDWLRPVIARAVQLSGGLGTSRTCLHWVSKYLMRAGLLSVG